MDLSAEEYQAFAEGIAALAAERERRAADFDAFRGFLVRNGPYSCLVDGANVALFGQNYVEGGFSWAQIRAVMQRMREEHPDKKPLLVRASASGPCPRLFRT
jgi:proteinaceous RNase P